MSVVGQLDDPDEKESLAPTGPTAESSAKDRHGGENSIARTLGLIGDEWNLVILRVALQPGLRRYNALQERLGIASSVLASRLRGLEQAGLLEKVQYQERPVRYEYRLTGAGTDVWKVLLAIGTWEVDYVNHVQPLERVLHKPCGQRLHTSLRCEACNGAASVHDVSARFGPSGGYERSVPRGRTRRRSSESVHGPGLVTETMALIGNRWSATLLAVAFQGARRFTEFEQRLNAPPTIVADRLRTFCELGVLTPKAVTERPDRNSYQLSEKGLAFFPVVMVAVAWGQRWFPDEEGPAMEFTHLTCNSPFLPRLSCRACGEEIHFNDLRADGSSEAKVVPTP